MATRIDSPASSFDRSYRYIPLCLTNTSSSCLVKHTSLVTKDCTSAARPDLVRCLVIHDSGEIDAYRWSKSVPKSTLQWFVIPLKFRYLHPRGNCSLQKQLKRRPRDLDMFIDKPNRIHHDYQEEHSKSPRYGIQIEGYGRRLHAKDSSRERHGVEELQFGKRN
jgi:hypothetical protein